jgi:hypothetical protein
MTNKLNPEAVIDRVNTALCTLEDFGANLKGSPFQAYTVAEMLKAAVSPQIEALWQIEKAEAEKKAPNKAVRAHLKGAVSHLEAIREFASEVMIQQMQEDMSGERFIGAALVLLVHAAGRRLDCAAKLLGLSCFGWNCDLSEFDPIS